MGSEANKNSAEFQKIVDNAWFFDVDGVITDKVETKVNSKVVEKLASYLVKGEPVILITGRSLEWLERVIKDLQNHSPPLDKFLIVAEKGASFSNFKNGRLETFTDLEVSVPLEIISEAAEIVKAREFSNLVFLDKTKKTMVTVETYPGTKENFDARQGALDRIDKIFRKVVGEKNLDGTLVIKRTGIAVDIESSKVGKKIAAQKALFWLNQMRIKPKMVRIFGDSLDDLEMAIAVNDSGCISEMIYVGEGKDLIGRNFPFPITFTHERFDKGTMEYLTSHT